MDYTTSSTNSNVDKKASMKLWSPIAKAKKKILDHKHRMSKFEDTIPFSPQAYNAISILVLESLYDCIEQISTLLGEISYYDNLGIVLYSELHKDACTHYFQEYEKIYELADNTIVKPSIKVSRIKRRGFRFSLYNLVKDKILILVSRILGEFIGKEYLRVGWVGRTTFFWSSLWKSLLASGLYLLPVKSRLGKSYPVMEKQVDIIATWAKELHKSLAQMFGVSFSELAIFGTQEISNKMHQLFASPIVFREQYDLIVTSTLGKLEARTVALHAKSLGIPVMTIHHGGAYQLHDDPFFSLNEELIPDSYVVYGRQYLETISCRSSNLSGLRQKLFSRSDSHIASLYNPNEKIDSIVSLNGMTAIYIANTMEGRRYGPFRDVHPYIYLQWQEQLLAWLEKQTCLRPLVRLHPKRRSQRYDPAGYDILDGDMKEVIDIADIFIIDYPTTSLSYVAATQKPVMFFDIGLRRLYSEVIENTKRRCLYAEVDMHNPKSGLLAMEAEITKTCERTFVPRYCLSEKEYLDEADAVAEAIIEVLKTDNE